MATGLSRVRRSRATAQETLEQKLDRAEEFYRRQLKAKLEKRHRGQTVAIDPDTHDYFVARDDVEAHKIGPEKFPGKTLYLRGIGYVTRIGVRGLKRRR